MNILLDATLGPNAASNPNSESSPVASGLHQCRVCKRTYERADHLNRHLKSHENARPFHCSRCPKRFNRADLLSRHLATHERHSNRDPDRPLIKRTDRAAEACLACAASKAKCEDQKPCRRCRTKNIVCETANSSFGPQLQAPNSTSTLASMEYHSMSPAQTTRTPSLDHSSSAYSRSGTSIDGNPPTYSTGDPTFATSGQGFGARTPTQPSSFQHATFAVPEIPSPALYSSGGMSLNTNEMSFNDMNEMLFLPNVSEFNQDLDFGFWDFNFEGVQLASNEVGADVIMTNHSTPSNPASSTKLSRDIARGYAAFKRSPWLWTPAQKDHQLDQDDLALEEVSISSGLTPSSAISGPVDASNITPRLDAGLRDRMFALIVTHTLNKLRGSAAPTFPSLDILNHILHIFFVRQSYQADNWIHAPTFVPEKCQPHKLLAIISAGSMFISVPAVWKMGLALQEVVRLSVGELVSTMKRYVGLN